MAQTEEMLNSFFGPQEQIPSMAEEDSSAMSAEDLASAESYIRGGMEDVYRKKMETFFGGKGKKATLKKVLLTLLEGAAGATGTPGIGARAWAGAQEEYKAKAPLLNRDIIAARNADREKEAAKRRIELKMAELRAKAPELAVKIEGMRIKNRLTDAQAEHELDKAILTRAKTENVEVQTEKTGKEIPYIGMTPAMKEAIAARRGIGNKNPLEMTPEELKRGMLESSLAKNAASLINAGQGSSSTTSYTKEIETVNPLTGKRELTRIPKTSTTQRAGKTAGLDALQSLFGKDDVLDSVKKAKQVIASPSSGVTYQQKAAPVTPPTITPGRKIVLGYGPKEAERIRTVSNTAYNARMTALTVLDALDGSLAKGVGPLAGSDWSVKARSWLNLKDTPEVIAQATLMRNQLKSILDQTGKATNETEMKKMDIVEPNKTDNNRELLIKVIASALFAEDIRIRSVLPSEEQEKLYADMTPRIMDHAKKLVTRLENQKTRVDPKTGQRKDPKFRELISSYDLSAASLYPELVQRGFISPKGEVGQVEKQETEINDKFGIRKRTR